MPLPTGFAEQLAKARANEEHCDYEIRCKGKIIKVHKLIIGIQSPVLNKACVGPFKENSSGFYKIQDFPADVVSAAVDYLYTGDYEAPTAITDKTASTHEAAGPILFHGKIFTFADKYLISSLKSLAESKFRLAAQHLKDTVALLNAFPAGCELRGSSVSVLQKALCYELRYRMQTVPYSAEITTALKAIASKCPELVVLFMELVWAEGTRTRRQCDCNYLNIVDVSAWRCTKCKTAGSKIILGSHSPVFLTAISGPFKVKQAPAFARHGSQADETQEKQTSEYEIKEATFAAVCKMVEFMYAGTYEAPPADSSVAQNICRDACFHAQMVALADKYLISALFEIARENFDKSVALEHNALELLGSVPDIYAIDADGSLALREVLVKNLDELLVEVGRDEVLRRAVEEVGKAVPPFSTDLLKTVLRLS
ncbi:hypothetical protein LLEC1_04761 [Akanthomyces lecanii]|uniref:BTB domain-containing protein n=1 Tax=Cordyceps confragosa TaxID=2714763 RepID=A0A179I8G7_CORDF|nr:hypothetical protein LLEC1_04761 [Akanthomyces lecanii]